MKTTVKITVVLLAMLVFIACKKDDNDTAQPEQVAKEITAEELSKYIIVEEYLPKASTSGAYGDKPILEVAFAERSLSTNKIEIHLIKANGISTEKELQTTYDANTGITSMGTAFGYYDFTRDQSGQVVVIKSRHNEGSNYFTSKYFDSKYIQLVKRGFNYFTDKSYKNITGNGYYRFSNRFSGFYKDRKWLYKENAVPTTAELTWIWQKTTEDDNIDIWYGQDGGTARYNNLFIALSKGNGWKGQHKDKDLLIVNTVHKDFNNAIGDIGVYEGNN